jgi:hypothetical protein
MRQVKYLTCPLCHTEFEGVGRRVYCSKKCRQEAYVLNNREKERERQRKAQQRRRKLIQLDERRPSPSAGRTDQEG